MKLADTLDIGSSALGVTVQVPSLAFVVNAQKNTNCHSYRIFCGNSSGVERHLAKVDVAGPIPVSRSKRKAIRSNLNRFFFIINQNHVSIICMIFTNSPINIFFLYKEILE